MKQFKKSIKPRNSFESQQSFNYPPFQNYSFRAFCLMFIYKICALVGL